jgi:hypothetical protein
MIFQVSFSDHTVSGLLAQQPEQETENVQRRHRHLKRAA